MKLTNFSLLAAFALTFQAGMAHACAKEDARNANLRSRNNVERLADSLLGGSKAPAKTATTSDTAA